LSYQAPDLGVRNLQFPTSAQTADPRFARDHNSEKVAKPGRRVPKNKTARALSTRAAGGTVGIDQEVVTLRGLFGNSGSQHDLTLGGSEP